MSRVQKLSAEKVINKLTERLKDFLYRDVETARKLAGEIEYVLTHTSKLPKDYNAKFRSLQNNLKSNKYLLKAVISGDISPQALVRMSINPSLLATEAVRISRAEHAAKEDEIRRNGDPEVYRYNVLEPLNLLGVTAAKENDSDAHNTTIDHVDSSLTLCVIHEAMSSPVVGVTYGVTSPKDRDLFREGHQTISQSSPDRKRNSVELPLVIDLTGVSCTSFRPSFSFVIDLTSDDDM